MQDDIQLTAATQSLNNVSVSATRPLVETKIDKTIVNVDASPTNTGLSALEVLEKSPGVTVDNDGNISLKGKQGVKIFIDGKPAYLKRAGPCKLFKKYAFKPARPDRNYDATSRKI